MLGDGLPIMGVTDLDVFDTGITVPKVDKPKFLIRLDLANLHNNGSRRHDSSHAISRLESPRYHSVAQPQPPLTTAPRLDIDLIDSPPILDFDGLIPELIQLLVTQPGQSAINIRRVVRHKSLL
jgi:hypothetical protein